MALNPHKNISPIAIDAIAHTGDKGFWVGFVRPDGQIKVAPLNWVHKVTSEKKHYYSGVERNNSRSKKALPRFDDFKTHESQDLNIVTGQSDIRYNIEHKKDSTVRNAKDAVTHRQEEKQQDKSERNKAKKHAAKVEEKRHATAQSHELVH